VPRREPLPTRIGDVLILRTDRSFAIHALGVVEADGQQDFGHGNGDGVTYISDLGEALAEAKRLCAPGRRVFLVDVDANQWKALD